LGRGEAMIGPWRRIQVGAIILAGVFSIAVIGYRSFGGYDWMGAIWMVVVTISTTGHAEKSEFGSGMQFFTVLVILFGVTASVYTFSGFFQLVLEGELDRVLGRRRMTRDIQQLSGHVVVCGYGRMGEHLVNDLCGESLPVVVVDSDPKTVDLALADGLLCVLGDATEESMLESVRIRHAKTLVTALPSDADSVFITLTARDMNPSLQIIARAEQRSTEKKLRQAGANRIVMPTIAGAKQMARMITRPGTAHLIDLVNEPDFQDVELDEVRIDSACELVDATLGDVDSLRSHDLLVVAIQRPQRDLIFNPKSDERMRAHDVIMLMGNPVNIQTFRDEIASKTPAN
jgi:voltage-gated potassium channel